MPLQTKLKRNWDLGQERELWKAATANHWDLILCTADS